LSYESPGLTLVPGASGYPGTHPGYKIFWISSPYPQMITGMWPAGGPHPRDH